MCVCPGAVCHAHSCDLQLMKLGCSRVACQINMSPTPRPSFRGTAAPTGRLLTLFTLFLLNSRVAASFLVALLRESSSYHDRCRPASAHFNPFACCSSPPPYPRPPSLSASGRFDPEQNHRSIRAYMLLTALSLSSLLHSARR